MLRIPVPPMTAGSVLTATTTAAMRPRDAAAVVTSVASPAVSAAMTAVITPLTQLLGGAVDVVARF